MKWYQYTAALALVLLLAGCGKKSDVQNTNDTADKAMRAAEAAKNNENDEVYDPEGDLAKKEKELFESENKSTRYAALEDASDYISLAKLSSDASGGVSLKFIKNYKGALSTVEIKTPKGMTPNQEYIIFYRDTPEGAIQPTHERYGFYAVDGSDDDLLRHFEQKYDKDNNRDKKESTRKKDASVIDDKLSTSSPKNKDDKSTLNKENPSSSSSKNTSTSKKSSSSSSFSGSSSSSSSSDSSKKTSSKTKDSSSKQTGKKSTSLGE